MLEQREGRRGKLPLGLEGHGEYVPYSDVGAAGAPRGVRSLGLQGAVLAAVGLVLAARSGQGQWEALAVMRREMLPGEMWLFWMF